MSLVTFKRRAHAVCHEWIEDSTYRVCIRPMLFNSEGNREVRYWPDPCEFISRAEAIATLESLEAAQCK